MWGTSPPESEDGSAPQEVEQRVMAHESKRPPLRQFGLGKGKLTIASDDEVLENTIQNQENHHATNSTD